MKIVIAPDSFKGSLSAAQAAEAMATGARDVFGSSAQIVLRPMADGGEGTLDAIAAAWGVTPEAMETVDAIGRPVMARFGISADGKQGVIEAAEANGLPAVCDVAFQPLRADTFGVGLIARELLDRGVSHILMCVGGSATTDGGTGMLVALGVRFLNADGRDVAPGGGGLTDIVTVDASSLHPRAREATWDIAVDVDSPLCGERGSAATFGPQKGATEHDIAALDAGLANLAEVLRVATGNGKLTAPGTGAAGGMPVCLMALLGARMHRGSALVAHAVGLSAAIDGATFVLTGEGSFDSQSLDGKVVTEVVALTPHDCPVIVIAGRVGLSSQETRAAGITAAFSISQGATDLVTLMTDAAERVRQMTAHVCAVVADAKAASAQPPFLAKIIENPPLLD